MPFDEVSFDGMGGEGLTFKHTTLTKDDEGKVVKIAGNGTVSLCDDGDEFYGKITWVDPDRKICVVVRDGVLSTKYSGSMSAGKAILVADATGGVKTNATGLDVVALDIDATNGVIYFQK